MSRWSRGGRRRVEAGGGLGKLIEALPDDLRRQALTHSSWTAHRTDSYGRLAFLGDSVLGLAIAEELYNRFPRSDIGRLTKVHGQTVSGRACAQVAHDLGLSEMLREVAPEEAEAGIGLDALLSSERSMASICEAMIGACYLAHGYGHTSTATVETFSGWIDIATETLLDFKSALQEKLARAGSRVTYVVVHEVGPPHARRFEVEATVDGEVVGRGEGRSKKAAEQAAAASALERRRR